MELLEVEIKLNQLLSIYYPRESHLDKMFFLL